MHDKATSDVSTVTGYRLVLYALAFSIALAVFGARMLLIREFGTNMPVWDEWTGIGATTLQPWLEGHFGLRELIAAHNEHRIALTRLIAIAVVSLNRLWEPNVLLAIHAAFSALCVALLFFVLPRSRTSNFGYNAGLALICIIWASTPVTWENILSAFQTQLYLMIACSITALWCFASSKPLSLRWWLGFILAFLALWTQSSGVLCSAAGIALLILQYENLRAERRRTILAAILLLSVFTLGFYLRVEVPWHSELKVRGIRRFAHATIQLSSWPFKEFFLWSTVMYLPWVVLTLRSLVTNRCRTGLHYFWISVGLWAIVQMLAIAFMRGQLMQPRIESRYLDLLLIGSLANIAALLFLAQEFSGRRFRIASALWAAIFSCGLLREALESYTNALPQKKMFSNYQVENVRASIATRDKGYLHNKPYLHTPFLLPDMLFDLLRDQRLASILPPTIREPLTPLTTPAQSDGFEVGGVHESAPKLLGEIVNGSFTQTLHERGVGRFVSGQYPTPKTPYLEVHVSGYLSAPDQALSLILRPADSSTPIEVRPSIVPGEQWQKVVVRAPASEFTVEAIDDSAGSWFAFTPLREVGRLGALTGYVLSFAEAFLCFGLLLPLVLLFLYQGSSR